MTAIPCHYMTCDRPADIRHLVGDQLILVCARCYNNRPKQGIA